MADTPKTFAEKFAEFDAERDAAYDEATKAKAEADAKKQARIDAAGLPLMTRANPTDEAIGSGQCKSHPVKPESFANIAGVLHVLERID